MQTRIHLKSFLAALAIGLGSLLVPSPAALAATTYVVNDGGGDCGSLTENYADIQTAVTSAITSKVKTILVCPGSYDTFNVTGANKLTIKAALPGTFPIVKAPNASQGDIILVENSSGVVIDGLLVDGTNFVDTLTGFSDGIAYLNASGAVQNSIVTRVRCFPNLCHQGYGIVVYDEPTDGKQSILTVKNVSITDFDVAGLQANGDAKLIVTGARVMGNFSGGTGGTENGVLFDTPEATGSVTKSTISGVNIGVSLVHASKVTISGTTIHGAANAISIYVDCGAGIRQASSNKIVGNTLLDVGTFGISIINAGGSCAHSDKNTISGNRITGGGGFPAVYLSVSSGGIADKNKISGNTVIGFNSVAGIDPSATHTMISKNTWLP